LITGDKHFEEEIILILGFEMIANTPTLAAPLAIGVFVHDEFIKKDVHPLMDRNYLCVPDSHWHHLLDTDPLMEPYSHGSVLFSEYVDSTAKAIYTDINGKE